MFEKILVPLDGSQVGEAALPYVTDLVQKLVPCGKVEVVLLQVVSGLTHYVLVGEVSAQVPYSPKEMEQIVKSAKAYLEKVGKTIAAKGATVTARVETGPAAQEIIRVADETKADMIAMSTHGRSGLSRWALGSVTDKVLREGNRPVFTVRAPLG